MEMILGAIAQSTGERPTFCAPGELLVEFFWLDLFSDFLFSLLSFSGASAGERRAFVQ
jgi:hypothetical protein